ncbi:MAG TPA: PepSY-associated TM helix domain-containing protein, partial [Polyangiales bacterium]|nr:PepSY-associated TM helix domain-containing protein [Polyangiales bacterium]
AQTLITKTLASQPEAARELEIHIDRTELLTWKIQEEGADEHDELSAHHFVARLGADGSVHAAESQRTQLAELIDVLHRVVGLPVDTDLNRSFMGVIAVLYFIALASGLITLLPSLIKDLFALRVGPNLKRMWLDAHNVVGLGSFPFHVIMALTAAVFAFHDPIYFVQNTLIHDGKLAAAFRPPAAPGSDQPRDPATMVSPQEIVARVQAEAPDFEPTVLRYVRVKGPSPSVFVFGHVRRGALEQRALGGIAMVDPYAGRIVSTAYLPGRQSIPETMLASFFALHFGSFGGSPLKWMYFALALLGAWLVYSGNLLWIESRGRKAKARVDGGAIPVQRRDTRLMASATVGV